MLNAQRELIIAFFAYNAAQMVISFRECCMLHETNRRVHSLRSHSCSLRFLDSLDSLCHVGKLNVPRQPVKREIALKMFAGIDSG